MKDLAKYVRDTFAQTKLSGGSQKNYAYTVVKCLTWLRDELGVKDPRKVTTEQLLQLMEWLHERHTSDTVGVYMAAVRRFYGRVFSIELKRADKDPTLPLPRHKQRRKVLPRIVEDSVVKRAIDSLDPHDFVESRLAAFIALASATGARREEILNLTLDSFGPRLASVTYPASKRGVARTVPVHTDARKVVRAWLKMRERRGELELNDSERATAPVSDYVFVSWRTGGRLNATAINRALPPVFERMGVVGVTPHHLRHGFITRCVRNGVDIKTIKTWVGHKLNSDAIDVYTHLDVAAIVDAHRRSHPMR